MTSTTLTDLAGLDTLFSAEELHWRDTARRVADETIRPVVAEDWDRGHFRAEVIPALASAGFLGMHLEGYGCAGAGAVSYGLVCAELEAADSGWRTFVSVQGSLAMSAIAKFGSDEQKSEWLPRMARGEAIGCFGLTEPGGGSDPAGMTTRAVRDGDDWVLNGAKRWIGLASIADVAVVWAQTDDGVRGFLVPTDTAGFSASPIVAKLSMRASIQCDIVLDDVRLPDPARLPDATGLGAPFRCLNEARFGIIWGVMGAARECIEQTVDRAVSRSVFGRPIGQMQLTQAKIADMAVDYTNGMLLALHLGRLKEAGTLAPPQISVGKLNNVRAAIEIASTARTILAGDGITGEFSAMRHMANLESVRTYEGTDEIHALVIGRALTGLNAF